MVTRRHCLSAAVVALAAPVALRVQAQKRLPVVGFLEPQNPWSPEQIASDPTVVGLRELGWELGKTVNIEFVYAEGRDDRLPALAAALVAKKVDVIVTRGSSGAIAAKRATDTIPIEGKSLGQKPIAVRQQSADPAFGKFRENLRWTLGGVLFVSVHTVGDNDNFGRTPEMDAEHVERKAASLVWLKQAFAEARTTHSRGVVIATQANPRFESLWSDRARGLYLRPPVAPAQGVPRPPLAFDDYLNTLVDELESYGRPVAYLHGDTHTFRIDKPLYSRKTRCPFPNFTRVETFGWPDSHWVRITVDPGDPQLFRFKAEVVPGNTVNGER